jgi:NADH-quinone oxidoreductase subunit H
MTPLTLVATIVKILVMVMFVLNLAAILTWADRRQSSMIQDRIGPNRAVIKIFGKEFRLAGLLHPAADGLKFFTKEDFMPPKADRLLFMLAPMMAMGMVFTLVATIPFGDTICPHQFHFNDWFSGPAVARYGTCSADARTGYYPIDLMVAPLGVGILYVFAMSGQGIIGAAIAGWSSDNKFSLMGALRAASQMVSYEVTLGLTLIGAVMMYGTLRIDEMIRWQAENTWGIFVQPLAFVLFFAAAVAESKRIPFDLPEGESELVAGYYTEYSGMKFAMFFFAEYVAVVTSSALMAAIFFGGWHLPFVVRDGVNIAMGDTVFFTQKLAHPLIIVLGVLGFIVKTVLLCMIQLTIRWTLPRFRYDQLMKLGWRKLLPASLANILVTGLLILAVQEAGPSVLRALRVASDLSEAFVAFVGIATAVIFVRFLLEPATHRRVIASTSARYAALAGGTRTARMGA